MQTMTIPRRFRGPLNSGNGGYVCGMLARRIADAAEVTLRAPPPLETELDLVEVGTGVWELRQGTATIAIGQAVTLDLSRLERATYAEAVGAEKRTPIKPHEHLLPMCFVCGPDRAPGGDGLRLFAGPLVRQHASGAFAVPWTPDASLAAADGLVATEFVWSALDCPTGYVSQYEPEAGNINVLPILLGAFPCASMGDRVRASDAVTSWKTGSEGRRLIAQAALFGEEDNLLAVGVPSRDLLHAVPERFFDRPPAKHRTTKTRGAPARRPPTESSQC
jgi:hypothetical protein